MGSHTQLTKGYYISFQGKQFIKNPLRLSVHPRYHLYNGGEFATVKTNLN